ncbi:MAG: DUF4124 domain-containing protein [Gammaproteobacteria bacterium]
MKNFRLWLIGMLVLGISVVTPPTALGAVYKSIAPNGSVTYSDQPQAGAKEVELAPEPPPPVKAPAATAGDAQATAPAGPIPEKPPFTGYTAFAIVSPENDATLRENNGNVEIQLAMEPALYLEAGHKITALLDGKPVAEGLTELKLILANIDRGTHTVEAQVSDGTGALLATTNPVTFHLKRISTIPLADNPLLAPDSPAPTTLQAPRAPQGQAATVPVTKAP